MVPLLFLSTNKVILIVVFSNIIGKNFHIKIIDIVNNNNEVRFMNNNNKLVVPGSKQAVENLKYEVAHELGIQLGPDTSSRLNGSVGGEMTKRLVNLGKQYYTKINSRIK